MMSDPSPHSPDQVEDDAEGDLSPTASTAQQNLPFVVKNRTSSGCLIVRKKGNDSVGGLGSSSARNVFGSKKEKKRARKNMSDSGSSDEMLMTPQRRVAPETLRVCSVLSHFDSGAADENDMGRKRIRNHEVDVVGRGREDISERKRNRLDVFEFDEYDGSDEEMRRKPFGDGRMEGKRYFSPMTVGRSGLQREFETGSSRHSVVDRSGLYLERKGVIRGDNGGTERTKPRPFYGDKYDSDGNIRVQGKSGVLKVIVNKKKKVSGSLDTRDSLEVEEKRKGLRSEDTVKRNNLMRPSFYSEPKISEKAGSSVSKPKTVKKMKSSSQRLPVRNGTIKDQDSEDSETSLKLGLLRVEKNKNSSKAQLSTRSSRGQELDSEDSDTSLKLGLNSTETRKFTKKGNNSGKIAPRNELTPSRSKEGKVKRGTGTEKQILRERIREMLLSKGWTIDYRPRRNRDYQDAVYINPSGTAYWSIIKAYDALQKQLKDEEEQAKAKGDDSFRPLPDEVLSQLTRNTRKKMEKEMKRKQRDAEASENTRETAARRSSSVKYDEESMDSDSHEEKLSSFIKQSGSGKSVKSRMKGDQPHAAMEPSGVGSRPGKKSRKLGRCTLLVRNSNEGLNSDSDGYVPYSGKRTVLSWLIDCGAVKLSQKVRYMNRRRTKAMLEGWATRDGIHCGCCSKILTVSKFEIHAGSKQCQPFQNIYLDSGVSLLECQIDAWNRQESVESIGFHSVDVDGDDPNDDTCGLCGDGGDLICCDNCPSTFHQSCLDIEMLPPGDWHCPRCICYFCGSASEDVNQDDEATEPGLLTCSLCAKRYHKSCSQGVDALSNDTDSSTPCFCGKTCKEVFEQLQKYRGAKHELESGLSWSLIHRTDVDLDIYPQGRPQRVECNSKLAVALSVMDECFLPIVDRRSGVNILHNVLYNSGSNFSRLNYSGFYTATLERGDEIVAAASIRLHGTQLAEMPFIGTRHIYRRQGMCRQLFNAIGSALSSMKVQKMVIPAIAELTHTWTEVFGFTSVDKTLKQELKSINMLVFPSIDLLQKQLLEQENIGENKSIATDSKETKIKDDQCSTPEAAVKSDNDSSAKNDSDDVDLEHASKGNDEVSTGKTDPQIVDENKIPAPPKEITEVKSQSIADKLDDKPESSSPAENHSLLDSSHENETLEPAKETVNTDFGPSENENPCVADKMEDDVTEISSAENHSLLDSSHENEVSEPVKETANTDFGPSETENPCVADKMEDDVTESSSPAKNPRSLLVSSKDDVNPAPLQETVNADLDSSEIRSPCIADKVDNIPGSSSPAANNDDTLVMNGSLDSNDEQENVATVERAAIGADVDSGSKLPESTSDLAGDSQEENKQEVFTPAKGENILSCKESSMEDSRELNLNESSSSELKMSTSIEDTRPVEHPLNAHTVNGSVDMDSIPVVDHLAEDKPQSGEGKAETVTADVSSVDTVPSAMEIDGADKSCLQTNFDQKDEMVCDHSIKDSS